MNLLPSLALPQIIVVLVDIMMEIKSAGQSCDLNRNHSCNAYYLNIYQVIFLLKNVSLAIEGVL